ncbi:MAG TPA: hypothetical protein VK206_05040 [Anaerolineales bacterium]|nr:hypothetical protein [Anaerolineales bacterium]
MQARMQRTRQEVLLGKLQQFAMLVEIGLGMLRPLHRNHMGLQQLKRSEKATTPAEIVAYNSAAILEKDIGVLSWSSNQLVMKHGSGKAFPTIKRGIIASNSN